MNELHQMKSGIHFLFVSAALVVIIAGVSMATTIITPILISVFLSVLGTPSVLWLRKHHIPISIAVLLVISFIVGILVLLGFGVAQSTNHFLHELPLYQTKLHEQVTVLLYVLSSKGIILSDEALMRFFNAETMTGMATSFMSNLGSAFSMLVVILLTVSFILLEASSFPKKIRAAIGNPRAKFPEFTEFVNEVQRYMLYQTFIALITGLSVGIWLAILNIDFAVILGMLTFLLCYIPNVGSAITLVPTIAVAFIQFGTGRAVLVAAGYLAITFVLGSIIQPRLIGKKLGLSTLVVFLSLIVWGSLLGPIGMVLCVPLTMAMKFALELNENTRWIGVLLERDPQGTPRKIIEAASAGAIHEH